MKYIILFAFVLSTSVFAQYALPIGKAQLNAGVGFSSCCTPIIVGLDYGIHKDISVGGEVSYVSYGEDLLGSNYSHTIIGILANGNYHFNNLFKIDKQFDLYAGVNIGYFYWKSPSGYGGSSASGLGLGSQVGGRYYFNENFGVNLEFGGGNTTSGGKVGITYKF